MKYKDKEGRVNTGITDGPETGMPSPESPVSDSTASERKGVGLGIDAGGTYTDAVIYEFSENRVLAWAKSPTTHEDYAKGIRETLGILLDKVQDHVVLGIGLVSLSTTLATNAIVEDTGGRVGLILIGYDPYNVRKIGFEPKATIRGRHSIEGDEMEPLDEKGARRAADDMLRAGVDAFAVSSEIGVRNPRFERRVREIIRERIELRGKTPDGGALQGAMLRRSMVPIVLGSELTDELNCVKRANSAYLNARLIPLVRDLFFSLKKILSELSVTAPVMVVKGDGSLMSEAVAVSNPIEMVLSGPAASAVGGVWLSGAKSGCIVDMGGTTTDVAFVENGFLKYSKKGARIESFRTAVRTVDVHTFGLGGDSHIVYEDGAKRVTIGPRRVAPLCWLAARYPSVLNGLDRPRKRKGDELLVQPADFFLLRRDGKRRDMHPQEQTILEILREEGPVHILDLSRRVGAYGASLVRTERLEAFGDVIRAGLTPTDVLHAKGELSLWNQEASKRGVALYAKRAGVSPKRFMETVLEEFYRTLLAQLFWFVLNEQEDGGKREEAGSFCDRLVSHIVFPKKAVEISASIKIPVVFIGAPAKSIASGLKNYVQAEINVPEYHEVANAVGAITGGVTENVTVLIRMHHDGFVAYAPGENRYYSKLEDAKREIVGIVREEAEKRARRAGAKRFGIDINVHDREASVTDNERIYLETVVTARLNGIPSIVEH
ncbi:MAG: hydantoinase/oxoprolinase family protein [Spirochaetes bacterium]|nr:hydantoinase/oxoprolinase family protein [Spirochaetota bacterium]